MRTRMLVWLVVAALAVAGPLFVHNEFYLKVVFTASMYYLAAAGLNVLVGWSGQKSLGHAGLFAVGAYTAALLTTRLGADPWLALAASTVVAALFGIVIALPALRVKGPSLAMVTIAFGIVVEKIVTEWQEPFGGQQGIYGVLPLTFGGSALDIRGWTWLMLGLAIATHALLSTLLHGKVGRAFLAVQAAEVAAASVGVNVYRTKVLAFVISAFTCGLAGALMVQQNQYINSDFVSFNLSIFLLLVVLIGGPSVTGPALGAIVLTLLDAFLARWPALQHFIYGALLLFALYVMPRGLSGTLQRVLRRFTPERAPLPVPAGEWRPAVARPVPGAGPLLQASGLRKAYGGVVPTADVGLTLQAGHVHSLIGPNGAGKTTLLNILSGVVRADGGRVVFMDEDITGQGASEVCRRGIGRTFQNLKLFPHLSVFENVLVGFHRRQVAGFFAHLFALPAARRGEWLAREEAARLLHFMGLADWAHEPAGSLPYGLQRRVELARALATQPTLLMLDEPAAGLNPQETAQLTELIRRIGGLGITVLLIEHHMDLVMAVSDHVFVLDHGRKIAEGPPQQVRNDPRVIQAYLGVDEDGGDSENAHPATPALPEARYA
jgi:branched-chain amino acid transport system permease protein